MRIFKGWLIGILVVGMVVGIEQLCLAAAPPVPLKDWAYQVNIQGRVTNRAGIENVPDGAYDFVFTLQRSRIGAVPSWQYAGWLERKTVYVSNGIFNATLGTTTPFSILDPSYDYSLKINFNGEDMDRPQSLVAVPLATTARNLKGGSVDAIGSPAVKGESTSGYGVYGITGTWDKAGVYGYSALAKGIEGKSDSTAGVYGWSTKSTYTAPWWEDVPVGATVGRGDGLVGVHGSSTKNYGVYAEGAVGKGGIIGKTADAADVTDTGFGVAGSSKDGSGVYGISQTSGSAARWKAGVYGVSSGGKGVMGWSSNGIGVFGRSENHYGIWGKGSRGGIVGTVRTGTSPYVSDFGVYGEGLFGVVAVGDVPSGTGVVATGGNFGVQGHSDGGTGIKGSSGSSSFAGVLADNTGGGPALEIGRGRIKVSSERNTLIEDSIHATDRGIYYWAGFSGTKPAGKVEYTVKPTATLDEIRITNPNLTDDSVVLITFYYIPYAHYYYVNTLGGARTIVIEFDPEVAKRAEIKLNYLIIN